jgi:hypothetical protein
LQRKKEEKGKEEDIHYLKRGATTRKEEREKGRSFYKRKKQGRGLFERDRKRE